MNYADIKPFDINNGYGIAVSLWVTGCPIKCPNCHNEDVWDKNKGTKFTEENIQEILELLSDERIDLGFSVLGGEPLAPYNYEEVLKVVKKVRETYPNKVIMLWTGYNYDKISNMEIFKYLDRVIDGMYIDSLKDENTWWRGSSNQRMIKLK